MQKKEFINQLILGDCLTSLKEFESNYFDLICYLVCK